MTENKIELMSKRHSVRNYSDQVISDEMIEKMQIMIKECNQKSGLSIQLIQNEPKAFDSFMAHYGKFQGVSNYIALIGKKGKDMEEICGYYGEKIVLYATELGLQTCWVYSTYKKVKSAMKIAEGGGLSRVLGANPPFSTMRMALAGLGAITPLLPANRG